MIWVTQTRYDLSFAVTLLASALSMVADDPRFLSHFLRLCAVSTKKLMQKDITIWFHPLERSSVIGVQDQLIAFSDAGYANLPFGCSTESCFIGFVRPLRRYGIIERMAHPTVWSTRGSSVRFDHHWQRRCPIFVRQSTHVTGFVLSWRKPSSEPPLIWFAILFGRRRFSHHLHRPIFWMYSR